MKKPPLWFSLALLSLTHSVCFSVITAHYSKDRAEAGPSLRSGSKTWHQGKLSPSFSATAKRTLIPGPDFIVNVTSSQKKYCPYFCVSLWKHNHPFVFEKAIHRAVTPWRLCGTVSVSFPTSLRLYFPLPFRVSILKKIFECIIKYKANIFFFFIWDYFWSSSLFFLKIFLRFFFKDFCVREKRLLLRRPTANL